jgi:indolepyruvate decarboxylase
MGAQGGTLAAFLLHALHRRGVDTIFGIPGDFALNFFKAIQGFKKMRLVTLSHEPGLGFAADGWSRVTGKLGAVAITFGAGAFNIVNPIACAYAEKSPLVIISGAPGMSERGKGILFHHQAKSLQSQRNVFAEVTAYQAILEDLESAPAEIEKALTIATQLSAPVYIEIPRDRVFGKISGKNKITPFSLAEDHSTLEECAEEAARKIEQAKRPVLMVGVEVHRFGLRRPVVRLAEKLRIPVVSSFLARATFPVNHPLFVGTYLGPAGNPRLMSLVEKSDGLLLLGVLPADTNMALRLSQINHKHMIHAINRNVTIAHHAYENVPLISFIQALLKKVHGRRRPTIPRIPRFPKLKAKSYFDDTPLTVEAIIQSINHTLNRNGSAPVIADNGDCLFASLDVHTEDLIASGYYATMGFAVPAGLGVQLGSKRRPIVLVGDGAFQMTGPEICHAPGLGLNPIVIVFNNRSWEMLRIMQPEGKYFDLTGWNFAQLAELWGGRGLTVRSKREMFHAIEAASKEKRFVIIDALLPKGETSQVLRNYVTRLKS